MSEFRMPSLGADMAAGTLVEWKVKPGDRVNKGDVIAEVETDKGIIDIEVYEDGVLDQILIQSSQKVPVGTVLALIRAEGEPVAVTAPAAAAPILKPVPEVERPPAAPLPAAAPGERLRVSPLARKLAGELGVDLSTVKGTGPHGTIERVDVERAAAELKAKVAEPKLAAPPPPPVEVAPLVPPAPPEPVVAKPAVDFQAGMRRAIAAAMSRSNRDIPHYYLEMRIDLSRALRWLEAENLKRSIKDRLLPVVLLIKATARALVDVPELNGFWVDDQLQPQEAINIGFAISLRQGGLVTPAIHTADLKSLDELMVDMRDIIMRTRAGKLRSSDLTDSTITLTSLGDLGVEKVYGVIYPPQVALVGFGKISEQPWVENSMLALRQVVTATLAGDHRATDGHRGGQFLEALNRQLQEPEKL
ncbi:MAG: 2-oxo acid dehydrogenase subunit E2 [Anaerolineales bacterium]|nr:2-oxo acid dehydrogenase subunit E2 [Anaerolineales bacterium]